MRPSFYHPSGQIPVLAAPALLACLGLAAAAALPYAWVGARAPWYLGIITVWPFALWLGLIVKTAGYVAKVRNPLLMKEFGVVVGLFGWACHWIFWIVFASYDSVRSMPGQSMMIPLADLLAYPWALFDAIQVAFTATGWDDDIDAGVLRCVGWLFECAVLVVVPCEAGRTQAGKPFCERSHRWATVTRLPYKFAVEHLLHARADFVAHPEQVLARLSLARSTHRFAMATLYSGQEESFLSVEVTESWVVEQARRQRKEMVVEYLRVPKAAVDGLLKRLSKRKRAKARAGGKTST